MLSSLSPSSGNPPSGTERVLSWRALTRRRPFIMLIVALFGSNIAGSLIAGSSTSRYRSKYILAVMYGSRAALIGWYLLAPKTPAVITSRVSGEWLRPTAWPISWSSVLA